MSRVKPHVYAFPTLRRRGQDDDWSEPISTVWRRLEFPIGLEIPSPPRPELGQSVRVESLGPKRGGLNVEVQRVRTPAKFLPRQPPPGSEHHGSWRPLLGTNLGEWDARVRQPGRWEVSHLSRAYREARRILRRIGLTHDAEAWCWRDPRGHWWVAGIPGDADVSPVGEAELCGAWLFPRKGRRAELHPRLVEFLDAFGGPTGPVAWAFFVVDAARDLRSVARGPNAERNAFALGLDIGQGLAEFALLGQVAAGEARRTAAGGKSELRAFLREIAKNEHADRGTIKPHKLAAVLIAEHNTTERGRRLAKLGVPTADRLGRLIAEEAEAEGIYRRQ